MVTNEIKNDLGSKPVVNKNMTTKTLLKVSMLIAINIIAYLINFKSPWGSMVHLGNIMLFCTAIIFGGEIGGLSGGISAALFDLFGGHAHYTLWSLVIKGLTGYTIGKIANSKDNDGMNIIFNVLACLMGGLVSLVGYVICWAVMYGPKVAYARIPSSLISTAIGMIGIGVAMAIKPALKKSKLI